MNQDKGPANIRKRAWTAGIGICFVAVILWTGIGSIRNSQKKIQEQQAKLEESQQANTEDILLPEEKTETQGNSGEGQTEETQEEAADQSGELQVTQSERARTLSFSENSLIEWPASGSVLINYSMDKTTYFPTLDQYRYNPALIIGGQEGEPIYASAEGLITGIEQSAQTGTMVTMDLGNGYSASYGELKDLSVAEGQYVNTGDLIGYLSQPTKYYSVEGVNLYFEMEKDGNPVNPMDFMEQ